MPVELGACIEQEISAWISQSGFWLVMMKARNDAMKLAAPSPVRSNDDIDHQRELDLLLLTELSLQRFAGIFQLVPIRESRQSLGPAECGTFAVRIVRGLLPPTAGRFAVPSLPSTALAPYAC